MILNGPTLNLFHFEVVGKIFPGISFVFANIELVQSILGLLGFFLLRYYGLFKFRGLIRTNGYIISCLGIVMGLMAAWAL